MRKHRHFLAILLALFFLAACSSAPATQVSGTGQDPAVSGIEQVPAGAEMALITTEARLESDFGQGVSSTVSRFAGESGLTSAVYKADAEDEGAAVSTLELAVKSGAQLVVAMDTDVVEAISPELYRYANIQFLLLDAPADFAMQHNVAAIRFSPEQGGWLAGYVAGYAYGGVVAYVAGPTQEQQRYALGFALGAEAGTADIVALLGEDRYENDETGTLPLVVGMTGLDFAEDASEEEREQLLQVLFSAEDVAHVPSMVFAPDADLYEQMLPHAKDAYALVMGVDVPDTEDTSFAAGLVFDARSLVYAVLESWQNGHFPGGREVVGGIADGDILMAIRPFSAGTDVETYAEKALARFTADNIVVFLEETLRPGEDGRLPAVRDLPLEHLPWMEPGGEDLVAPMGDSFSSSAVPDGSSTA